MSFTPSAVALVPEESPIVDALRAHDLHGVEVEEMEAAPQTTGASMDLESPRRRQPSSSSPRSSLNSPPPFLQHNSQDRGANGAAFGVTTSPLSAHDPLHNPAEALIVGDNHDQDHDHSHESGHDSGIPQYYPMTPNLQGTEMVVASSSRPRIDHIIVAPPSMIVPLPPTTPFLFNLPTAINNTKAPVRNHSPSATSNNIQNPASTVGSTPQEPSDRAGDIHADKMKNPVIVLQRRRNFANTNAVTDYEADLTSKDRAKQKEAVKKFLMDRVRDDWTWEWPRPEPKSDESSPERAPELLDEAILQGQWKERDEWLSNASESEGEPTIPATASSPDTPSPTSKSSPFRFESPDGVGMTIKKSQMERKRRRKKRLAEEMASNEGLRCFVARRDAWTGARRVSRSRLGFVGAKLAQEVSASSEDGGSSTAIEHEEEEDEWEDEIEIPIAPPIIPPENAMRASILPAAYNTIYDKVVVQGLTPSCPMNLKDIMRSCVQGWKRDGEWPPKAMPAEQKKKGRKMSIASLFGVEKHEKEAKEAAKPHEKEKEKEAEKKGGPATGIRKGLQKILSLGHSTKEHTHTNGNDHGGKGKEPEGAHVS